MKFRHKLMLSILLTLLGLITFSVLTVENNEDGMLYIISSFIIGSLYLAWDYFKRFTCKTEGKVWPMLDEDDR